MLAASRLKLVPMTLIEIAIYAAVLGSPRPMVCHLEESGLVRCSNGLIGEAIAIDAVRFSDGVVVRHRRETIAFSNGIKTHLAGDGGLRFSNGVSLRPLPAGDYAFSNGIVCRSELPELVRCEKAPSSG